MRDEEILQKYGIKIKRGIDKIIEKYEVTDPTIIEFIAQKYKESFVTGFKEGIQIGEARGAIEVAKNLLKAGITIDIIVESTGLFIEEVTNLKG
jgi:predicted transposase/invertase (TIGR01784 family)